MVIKRRNLFGGSKWVLIGVISRGITDESAVRNYTVTTIFQRVSHYYEDWIRPVLFP
jgi:hypothetical protein